MSESARQIRIGTLRVCAAGRNDPGMRLALSRLLDNADPWPRGMPPAAVLIVRRLDDPLPHRLQWRSPQARPYPAWEKAAQRKLADLYAHAARPGRGSIPANVEAVRFEDEAEMLACLLVDMNRQEARQQWWWRTLLRDLPDAGTAGMTVLLHRRAAQVPAVLQRLVESGQAIKVIRALAPSQALAVATAMAQAYGVSLPLQPPVRSRAAAPVSAIWPAEQRASAQPAPDSAPVTMAPAVLAAPWCEWLPDSLSTADLSREQACLLGVGLSLRRAPAVVRSPSFLRRLQDWWLAALVPPVQSRPSSSRIEPLFDATEPPTNALIPSPWRAHLDHIPVSSPPFQGGVARSAGVVRPDRAPPSLVNNPPISTAPTTGPFPSSTEQGNTVVPTLPGSTHSGEQAESLPASSLAPLQTDQRPGETITPAPPVVRPDSVPPLTASLHAEAERQPWSDRIPSSSSVVPDLLDPVQIQSRLDESAIASRLAGGVTTALGGVWYLINLMVYLDLPDCFEDDWGLATRLGTWGTLDALARALLSNSDAALEDDPLWPALLELGDRRADEPLGANLPPDRDFRLPPAWLAGPDEPAAYVWAENGRRLRLWSTQGYLLAEVACKPASAASRAMAELGRYRLVRCRVRPTHPCPLEVRRTHPTKPQDDALVLQQRRFVDAPLARFGGSLTAELSPALKRWLSLAVPAIRWRLRRALADSDEADSLDWLRQPGQLYITSTHVDLVMSLDSVSIPLRLAGLDRDPGWLPDFGRIIRFHFD